MNDMFIFQMVMCSVFMVMTILLLMIRTSRTMSKLEHCCLCIRNLVDISYLFSIAQIKYMYLKTLKEHGYSILVFHTTNFYNVVTTFTKFCIIFSSRINKRVHNTRIHEQRFWKMTKRNRNRKFILHPYVQCTMYP